MTNWTKEGYSSLGWTLSASHTPKSRYACRHSQLDMMNVPSSLCFSSPASAAKKGMGHTLPKVNISPPSFSPSFLFCTPPILFHIIYTWLALTDWLSPASINTLKLLLLIAVLCCDAIRWWWCLHSDNVPPLICETSPALTLLFPAIFPCHPIQCVCYSDNGI